MCSGFLGPKSISAMKSAKTAQELDRKARFKASFTFGHDLRPKARKQNSAIESSSLGKCQGYRKEA